MNNFEKQLHEIFGKNSAFGKALEGIFPSSDPAASKPEPQPTAESKYYLIRWEAGGQEVIWGDTLAKAWSAKGWSKAKIKEMSSYKEL